MKRRWWLIAPVAALAILLPARAHSQQRRAKSPAQIIKLIATCYAIQATGKRRQSWVFQFKVVSVSEGRYEEQYVHFELAQGGSLGGEQLLALVGARKLAERGDIAEFDRQKKVELTFESRSTHSIQELELRSFRTIE